jgi:hypothetical protein
MLIKLALIICVICALNGSNALTITENIVANGGGKLTCMTDMPLAKDRVDSTGIQTYSLVANQDLEKGTASLESRYSLNISHPKRKTANVSPSNEFNNASPNTTSVSITQTIINIGNTAPIDNTLANNLGENAIKKGDSRVKASVENLKNDLLENNISKNGARQKEGVPNGTVGQASINKGNAMQANYNYLPIYSRSFRVKSSSTEKFDTPYNISEDHSSEDSSQNHYSIKMIYPNHLEHGAEFSGADNFTADNTISFKGGQVTTDYKMGGNGILKGSVMSSGRLGRPHAVAETRIEDSNFTIRSGVEDEAQIGYKSDLDRLSNGAEKTEVGSEEKQDESKKNTYKSFLGNMSEDRATGNIEPIKAIRFVEPLQKSGLFWFVWDEIPDDNTSLIHGLKDLLGYEWVDNKAKIEKSKDNMTIHVYTNNKAISLTLSADRKQVSLTQGSEKSKEFIVEKMENDELDVEIPNEYLNNSSDDQSEATSSSNDQSEATSSSDDQSEATSSSDDQSKTTSSSDDQSKATSSSRDQGKATSSSRDQGKATSSSRDQSKAISSSSELPAFWFVWDEIPGDNTKLIGGLKDLLGYKWVDDKTKIEKSKDNMIIHVYTNNMAISLTLSADRKQVSLTQGSEKSKEFIVEEMENGELDVEIPNKYRNNSSSDQSKATSSSDSNKVNGTIIPGPVFGSPVNSIYANHSVITGSNWGMAYIGKYKPIPDKNYGMITGNYSLKVNESRFEFEDVNSKEPRQEYLNIRYEGSSIRIRSTPPGTRFEIFNGPI